MGLATLTEVKGYLGVTGTDQDAAVAAFVDAATRLMEHAARRHLEAATAVEYLNGTGGRCLWLAEPPDGGKAGVTSVHVDGARAWSAASLLAADQYLADGCTVERLDGIWPRGRHNVRVVYKAGFAAAPGDLRHACKVQAARFYAEWRAAGLGLNVLQSHSVQGWAQSFLERCALDPQVAETVERYRPARL
jgi:hypothetical protein